MTFWKNFVRIQMLITENIHIILCIGIQNQMIQIWIDAKTNYIELRNAKYYWIIANPDMSHTEEIISLHILHLNIFGGILFITWLKKTYIN